MLVTNQKYDVNAVVALKLVNGDEVVAKIIEDTDTAYIVDTPMLVVPSQQGLGLIQSLFSAEQGAKVTLSKQHVMMTAPVIDQMRDHYSKTTTGLETVRKPGIIV
jgi:hypothetical protein